MIQKRKVYESGELGREQFITEIIENINFKIQTDEIQ